MERLELIKEIRSIVKSVIMSEAISLPHFNDRVTDRLNSEYTTFMSENPQLRKTVFDNIKFLGKVNFPGFHNVGIMLLKGPNLYKYKKVVSPAKTERDEGSFIWAVMRGNELETIFFKNAGEKPQNTQIHVTSENLKKYIDNVKNGDYDLTEKDMARIARGEYDVRQAPVEKEKEQFIIINGTKWIPNKEQEIIHQKNKPDNSISIYDVGERLGKEVEDVVLAMFV